MTVSKTVLPLLELNSHQADIHVLIPFGANFSVIFWFSENLGLLRNLRKPSWFLLNASKERSASDRSKSPSRPSEKKSANQNHPVQNKTGPVNVVVHPLEEHKKTCPISCLTCSTPSGHFLRKFRFLAKCEACEGRIETSREQERLDVADIDAHNLKCPTAGRGTGTCSVSWTTPFLVHCKAEIVAD